MFCDIYIYLNACTVIMMHYINTSMFCAIASLFIKIKVDSFKLFIIE